MMLLESDIEETYQASMKHCVAVCKNYATNQLYCYFYEERRSLQFASDNTSIRDIGYNDIHFPPFSLRESWRRYHPTAPLVNGEADVRGDLN